MEIARHPSRLWHDNVEMKTMLWLEVKNLHVEIDGAAARALRRYGYLPRVLRSLQHEG